MGRLGDAGVWRSDVVVIGGSLGREWVRGIGWDVGWDDWDDWCGCGWGMVWVEFHQPVVNVVVL